MARRRLSPAMQRALDRLGDDWATVDAAVGLSLAALERRGLVERRRRDGRTWWRRRPRAARATASRS